MPCHDLAPSTQDKSTKPTTHPGQHTPVFSTPDKKDALSCSLMLSSIGIDHTLNQTQHDLTLSVKENDAEQSKSQILAYLHENKDWPPKPVAPADTFTPLLQPPTLLLVGSLALLYSVTGPWSEQSAWFTGGAGNADAILNNGEYYRLITALTLHADPVHLLGNCLFGGFLFHFFCKLTGNGLGLFAMLFTATLANLINVLLHGNNHLFVGFSTAVFALIGMMAMIGRRNHAGTKYQWIMPFMAGAALLAMIGSSGERTDLGAHLFGLCCGFATGWVIDHPLVLKLRESFLFQTLLFLSSLAIIVLAWKSALA